MIMYTDYTTCMSGSTHSCSLDHVYFSLLCLIIIIKEISISLLHPTYSIHTVISVYIYEYIYYQCETIGCYGKARIHYVLS